MYFCTNATDHIGCCFFRYSSSTLIREGDDISKILNDYEIRLTASFNPTHKQWLYDVLNDYCERDCWIAVQDHDGRIWSLYKAASDKTHFLLTTAFCSVDSIPTVSRDVVTQQDVGHLSKLSLRALTALCIQLKIEVGTGIY